MSFSIRRNEICPCMSGKKYKNCCLPRAEFLEEFHWQNFDEKFVLSEIVNSSESFVKFYESERNKIKKEIIWVLNPYLTSTIRCGSLPEHNCYFIQLKDVPLRPVDAFDLAHELQHIILGEEGFPLLISNNLENPELINTSAALCNMIYDPLVNSRIASFGFDLWAYYDKASAIQQEVIKQFPNEPENLLYSSAFYVQKVLDWELASSIVPRENNDFLAWYDSWYPETAIEAKSVVGLVKEIGYDTPQKALETFSAILKKFKVEENFKFMCFN